MADKENETLLVGPVLNWRARQQVGPGIGAGASSNSGIRKPLPYIRTQESSSYAHERQPQRVNRPLDVVTSAANGKTNVAAASYAGRSYARTRIPVKPASLVKAGSHASLGKDCSVENSNQVSQKTFVPVVTSSKERGASSAVSAQLNSSMLTRSASSTHLPLTPGSLDVSGADYSLECLSLVSPFDANADLSKLIRGVASTSWLPNVFQDPLAFDVASAVAYNRSGSVDQRRFNSCSASDCYLFNLREQDAAPEFECVYDPRPPQELTNATRLSSLQYLTHPRTIPPKPSTREAIPPDHCEENTPNVPSSASPVKNSRKPASVSSPSVASPAKRGSFRYVNGSTHAEQSGIARSLTRPEIAVHRQIQILQAHMLSRPQLPAKFFAEHETQNTEEPLQNNNDESHLNEVAPVGLTKMFSLRNVLSSLFLSHNHDRDTSDCKDTSDKVNVTLEEAESMETTQGDKSEAKGSSSSEQEVSSWESLAQYIEKLAPSPLIKTATGVRHELMVLLEEYQCLRAQEIKLQIDPDMMVRQTRLTPGMREILLDWLVDMHLKFKLHPITLHRAVAIIDRFLSVSAVNADALQGLGAAALNIASKFEELRANELLDFASATDHAISRAEVQRVEGKVLTALNFNVSTPFALSFASIYLRMLALTPSQDDVAALEASGHYLSCGDLQRLAPIVPGLDSLFPEAGPEDERVWARLPLHLVESFVIKYAKAEAEKAQRGHPGSSSSAPTHTEAIHDDDLGYDAPATIARAVQQLRAEALRGRHTRYSSPLLPTPSLVSSESGLTHPVPVRSKQEKGLGMDATAASRKLRLLVEFFCEAAFQSCDYLKYPPSLIGAAALCLALRSMNAAQCWTLSLSTLTGYSISDLAPACKFLREWCLKLLSASQRRLTATRSKYMSPGYMQVSRVTLPSDESYLEYAGNEIMKCLSDLNVSPYIVHLLSRLRLDGGRVTRIVAARPRMKTGRAPASLCASLNQDPLAQVSGLIKSVTKFSAFQKGELEYAIEWVQSPAFVWSSASPQGTLPYLPSGAGGAPQAIAADASRATSLLHKSELVLHPRGGHHGLGNATASVWDTLSLIKRAALLRQQQLRVQSAGQYEGEYHLVLVITQWVDASTLTMLAGGSQALRIFGERLGQATTEKIPCYVKTALGVEYVVPPPDWVLRSNSSVPNGSLRAKSCSSNINSDSGEVVSASEIPHAQIPNSQLEGLTSKRESEAAQGKPDERSKTAKKPAKGAGCSCTIA